MFAKLYGDGDDQILVKLDSNDDSGEPEVRFYSAFPDVGVCSIAVGFKDTDLGWSAAEKAFSNITEILAKEAVKSLALSVAEVGI